MPRSERKPPRAALAELARRRKAFGANELADLRALSGSAKFIEHATRAGVLGAAIRTGSVGAVAQLLEAGIDPNVPPSPTQPPPLHELLDDALVEHLDRLRDFSGVKQQGVRLAGAFLDLPARLEALETLEGLLHGHGATRAGAGEEQA